MEQLEFNFGEEEGIGVPEERIKSDLISVIGNSDFIEEIFDGIKNGEKIQLNKFANLTNPLEKFFLIIKEYLNNYNQSIDLEVEFGGRTINFCFRSGKLLEFEDGYVKYKLNNGDFDRVYKKGDSHEYHKMAKEIMKVYRKVM